MLNQRRGMDKVHKWLLRAEKDERIVPAMSAEVTGEVTACHDYIHLMEVRVDLLLIEVKGLKETIVERDEEIELLKHPENEEC